MRAVDLERVGCTICGRDDGVLAEVIDWKGTALRYAICPGCGLKYLHERPTRGWYADFYRDEFWGSSRLKRRHVSREPRAGGTSVTWDEDEGRVAVAAGETTAASEQIERRIARQRRRALRVWRIVRSCVPLARASRVLEIGASWGETLALLAERTGCQVMAVEPSSLAADRIEGQYGIPVVGHTLEELADASELEGSIDLVLLSHVLENTVEPVESLRIVRSLLSQRGHLYIDTCNLHYNNAINPYHPFIFSPETLRAVLGLAGLEVEYAEHAPNPEQVRRLAREADGVDPVERASYLAVVAVPGKVHSSWVSVDVPRLLAAQRRGVRLLRRARKWRRVRRWLGASATA